MGWQHPWTDVAFSLSASGFHRPEDSQGREGEQFVGMFISKLIVGGSVINGLSSFSEHEFSTNNK